MLLYRGKKPFELQSPASNPFELRVWGEVGEQTSTSRDTGVNDDDNNNI